MTEGPLSHRASVDRERATSERNVTAALAPLATVAVTVILTLVAVYVTPWVALPAAPYVVWLVLRDTLTIRRTAALWQRWETEHEPQEDR